MVVSEEVRKCVVFVGFAMADGQVRFAGTAFYLSRVKDDGNPVKSFLVTARHVLDGIKKKGLNEFLVRLNTKAGNAVWLKCSMDKVLYHPTDVLVDVAVIVSGIPDDFDHVIVPTTLAITDEALLKNEVGLGDEVFVVGLFRHHHGEQRNIPIVRVGSLAAMAEEKVLTRIGQIDAYLIEARSIGGLSGSPVFLNLGITRSIGGGVRQASKGSIFFLLGLIHGHFDVIDSEIDAAVDAAEIAPQHVNMGIAIVVPMHKILEVLDAHSE